MHSILALPYMETWTLSLKTITDKGQWKKWHNLFMVGKSKGLARWKNVQWISLQGLQDPHLPGTRQTG